jgi:hypothetical protein
MATSISIRFQWGRRASLLSLHSSACRPDSCATSTSLFLVTALLVVLCSMLSGKNYKCFVFSPLSRRLTMYHCSIHVSPVCKTNLQCEMWALQPDELHFFFLHFFFPLVSSLFCREPSVVRHVDSSTLAFSLSSHRPSFISLFFSSRFLDS